MQKGHIQDAIAICEILALIDNNDISSLTEYDIGEELTKLREKGQSYIMDSFPTICGFQENGAIIHYRAEKETALLKTPNLTARLPASPCSKKSFSSQISP